MSEEFNYYNQIAKSYNKLHKQEQLEKVRIILQEIKKSKKFINPNKKILFSPSQIRGEIKFSDTCKAKSKTLENKNLKPLLLDIGAGSGISTKPFEKYCTCYALDPSIELLKKYKGKKVLATAEKIPFKNKTFDIIISVTALHHTNLKQAIKEINRVAKPNSIIAISFLKKSKKLKQIKHLLKHYKQINSDKDIIFIKQ